MRKKKKVCYLTIWSDCFISELLEIDYQMYGGNHMYVLEENPYEQLAKAFVENFPFMLKNLSIYCQLLTLQPINSAMILWFLVTFFYFWEKWFMFPGIGDCIVRGSLVENVISIFPYSCFWPHGKIVFYSKVTIFKFGGPVIHLCTYSVVFYC